MNYEYRLIVLKPIIGVLMNDIAKKRYVQLFFKREKVLLSNGIVEGNYIMSREAEFATQLWHKLTQYLKKYTVNGHKLIAKEPDSLAFRGKIPDIVVVDAQNIPQLIIETKKKVEGKPMEELLNPLGPTPIAQAVCYAVLAMLEYELDITPLFATANRDALILFRGISRDDVGKIVDIDACLASKRSPEDWIRALKPGGLDLLLREYIIDRIEYPLRDESLKRLFEYVGKWLIKQPIPPAVFYRVFVSQLRSLIENLHEYIKDAVKRKILEDKDYFIELFIKAREAGYPLGLISKGILELKCPSNIKKFCECVKEYIERELRKARELTPEKAYQILSSVARKRIKEICSECPKRKRPETCSIAKKIRTLTGLSIEKDIISFENLTRMMTYVLANKIMAYKILELHYGEHIPTIKPITYRETIKVNDKTFKIKSPNNVIELLNYIFSYASSKLEEILGIKDFSPIFNTGLYDKVELQGIEAIDRINAIIDLVDVWKHELKYLPGIIGYVYEGLLPPKERHQLGQFYTPPAIARLITKWAIRSGNDRVLDAGCGSGTFLIEAYKRLLFLKFNKNYDKGEYPSCTERYNEHQEILNQLYGVDINAFASLITSIHLMLMEPRCPISRLNVETRDFFTLRLDSHAFGDVVGSFDAIIGNPPYTRWVEIPEDTKEFILERLHDELRKYNLRADLRRGREPGIYIYWIMHAAKHLLKERGRIGMIISNLWLQTDYGIDFANFLLDNFRIVALIDLSFRLFEALISTVIILVEKEPNEDARNDNVVTLIRVPPKIKGEELDLEKAGKLLDDVLYCIERAIRSDGSIDAEILTECQKEYGIHFIQMKQRDMPRDRKWISLFFAKIEDIVNELEKHPLMIRLSEWFEPSRGNSVWSIWALKHGKRPDLGAKDFFYFSEEKIDRWEREFPGFKKVINNYLIPAITRSQYIETFTFTKDDWETLKRDGKDAYIIVCSERKESLPKEMQEYIKWGETECKTQIRGTRKGGKLCSEAEACKARVRNPKIFKGWYDLCGYVPTPLMAVYQPRYHPQFFYAKISREWNLITYHAIITLIPRVRIVTAQISIDPIDYHKKYPCLSLLVKKGIELNEDELKALLAYFNSTFVWLWLEQNARYIAKGPLGLEVSTLREMPLINVKKLKTDDVKTLAELFDRLEMEARRLKEEVKTKLEMFGRLEPIFKEIDRKLADILNIAVDVEWLWNSAWEMMERRIKGAKGPARPGVKVSLEIDIDHKKGRKRKRRGSSSQNIMTLDNWLSKK